MLARTHYTAIYLRTAQATTDERMRYERIAAAKPKPRQINQQRFRALVNQVATILKTGQPTAFAFEGSCRHGIRSNLCLQGWAWRDADHNAAEIVAAALRQIGTPRPTWQQGQIGYTDEEVERLHCVNCSKAVAIGENGRPRKYCSSECMNSWHAKMNKRFGFQQSRAEYLASCAADRVKKANGERDCDRCGKRFKQGKNKDRTYCSECVSAVRNPRRNLDRACLQCGTMFRPKHKDAKFCGRDCMAKAFAETTRHPAQPCEHCGTPFHPTWNSKRFCSRECRYAAATVHKDKPCANCGTLFHPRFTVATGEAETCSYECTIALRRKERPERHCAVCKSVFRTRYPSDTKRYCSTSCATMGRGLSRFGIRCVAAE